MAAGREATPLLGGGLGLRRRLLVGASVAWHSHQEKLGALATVPLCIFLEL